MARAQHIILDLSISDLKYFSTVLFVSMAVPTVHCLALSVLLT